MLSKCASKNIKLETDFVANDVSLDQRIEEFREGIDAEQERRDKELFDFLEELVNSDEARKIRYTRDVSTQVIPKYLDKYARDTKALVEALVDNFALTRYFQERYKDEEAVKYEERCETNRKIRSCQDEAIAIIKERIYQAGQIHACHLGERIANRLRNIDEVLGGIRLRPEFRYRAYERVLSTKKIRREQVLGRKQREISIVNKLVNERKRWKEIQSVQNKTYDYKVERRFKDKEAAASFKDSFVFDEEVEGDVEELPVEKVCFEDVAAEKVVEAIKPVKDKGKKNKKDKNEKKKGGKEKVGKKNKDDKKGGKKSNKGKGKKNKAEIGPLVLPEVPIVNTRTKIKTSNIELLNDILQQHKEVLMVADEKKYIDAIFDDDLHYKNDDTCFWRPNPVLFNDFENDKIYKKRVTIINGGKNLKKIKLHSAIVGDGFDPYLIQVDKFGIALVAPGIPIFITMVFRPRQLNEITYGRLTFISCETKTDAYRQFSIIIKCIPGVKAIFVTPIHIRFGRVPFWKIKEVKPKKLRVVNTDSKDYQVSFKKILENSQIEEISEIISVPTLDNIDEMLNEISDICYHHFKFSKYFSQLPADSGFEVKIIPRHLYRIGCHFERFECLFLEKKESGMVAVGSQECMASIEITDHFIRLEPEILDFSVCSFASVYQETFSVFNADSVTHRILLQFPISLKPYLSSNLAEMIISPGERRQISLKFVPREDMVDGFLKYYDPNTSILKFPIKLQITTKDYEDVPPKKLVIFAVITHSLGLILKPLNLKYAQRNENDFLLDFGACSCKEAVYAKVGVTNTSMTKQHFGFLDLPMCLCVDPNYGFGVLQPQESRILKLIFHPESRDFNMSEMEGQKSGLYFRISVKTLKHIGALKQTFNHKKLRKSFQHILNVLKTPESDELEREMRASLVILRKSKELTETNNELPFEEGYDCNTQRNLESISEVEEESEETNNEAETGSIQEQLDDINSNKIWLSASAIDPPVSLSHQYVIFPNTPCGSYSIMTVKLKTLKYLKDTRCLCGYKSSDLEEFQVHFEICGDSREIIIEPICGDLPSGNSADLHLVARPAVPDEIVVQKAKYLKMVQMIEENRRQILLKRAKEHEIKLMQQAHLLEKSSKKNEKKDKKDKKKGGSKDEDKIKKNKEVDEGKTKKEVSTSAEAGYEPDVESGSENGVLPEIRVNPDDIRISYIDLYPAEMVIWRDYQPKEIEANFTVELTYSNTNKPKDYLYLKAVCRVVSPSFIHNLDTQHLEFGPTAIGDSKRQILELKNVQDVTIAPRTSFLNPIGMFSCPSAVGVSVPSEHVLKLPITFKPLSTVEAVEFLDIKCDHSTYTLMLTGQGVYPKLEIKPNFLVCRLNVQPGNTVVNTQIEILNHCEANINVVFEKVLELEGEMRDPDVSESKIQQDQDSSGGSKASKGKTSKKAKEKYGEKFGHNLSEKEVYSLNNYFEHKRGQSYFQILHDNVEVAASSKLNVKICFGMLHTDNIEESNPTTISSAGEKKGKKGKENKKRKLKIVDPKYYIAKYNVLLGGCNFIKDMIVIGHFAGK